MKTPEVKWLIEDFDPGDSRVPLIEEVRRQGFHCEVRKYEPFESGSYDCFPNSSDVCVIFQGSLNLGRQLLREKKWIPGVWCNLQNFRCTSYYPYFGQYLFNHDYFMLPLLEVGRRKKELFDKFGGGAFFIRPNSGFKPYSGQVVSQEHFDRDYEWMVEFSDPDAIAVIAPAQSFINKEWRFIICDRRVITGSTYKKDGSQIMYVAYDSDDELDLQAFQLAEKIANVKWRPEAIFSVDIVQSYQSLHLMEINSFSCSGLYACDLEKVVREASDLAIRECKEYQSI